MTDQQRAAAERGGVDTGALRQKHAPRSLQTSSGPGSTALWCWACDTFAADCPVLPLLDMLDQATAANRYNLDWVERLKREVDEVEQERDQATARVAGLVAYVEEDSRSWHSASEHDGDWKSCDYETCTGARAALAASASAPVWHGPPNGETGFLRASDGVGEAAHTADCVPLPPGTGCDDPCTCGLIPPGQDLIHSPRCPEDCCS